MLPADLFIHLNCAQYPPTSLYRTAHFSVLRLTESRPFFILCSFKWAVMKIFTHSSRRTRGPRTTTHQSQCVCPYTTSENPLTSQQVSLTRQLGHQKSMHFGDNYMLQCGCKSILQPVKYPINIAVYFSDGRHSGCTEHTPTGDTMARPRCGALAAHCNGEAPRGEVRPRESRRTAL